MNTWSLGGIIVYKPYRVVNVREPCGIPAYISLVVDISPSAEILNFLFEREELIGLIKLVEKLTFYCLRSLCMRYQRLFQYPRTL
jgi:hypothetical protein